NDNDFKVKVWDAESGEELASRTGLILDRSHFEGSSNLAIIPVLDETGSVILWDVIDDEIVSTLAGHAGWVDTADISDDGQIAFTVGCDEVDETGESCVRGTAKIWDATSGEQMLSLPHEPVTVPRLSNQYIFDFAVELRHDGSRLVTSACSQVDEEGFCTDNLVTIWDTRSGEQVTSFETGLGSIWRIEYSPDRSSLYTTGGDGTHVWDSETGELIRSLSGEFGAVDLRGERLVTVGDEFAATIWDIQTGAALATLSGHRDGINSVEFSPDDEKLITSSWDGTARVWNSGTGIEILSLAEHEGQVWDAHFSPDGQSIVTTSEDGAALIWPFAVDKLLELAEPSVQRYTPFLTPEELARFGLSDN
ncbi:MAG: WD40 repeat domain-containing protein, partial [Chloroflexota bacterium]